LSDDGIQNILENYKGQQPGGIDYFKRIPILRSAPATFSDAEPVAEDRKEYVYELLEN
jgi:hypothetical protein